MALPRLSSIDTVETLDWAVAFKAPMSGFIGAVLGMGRHSVFQVSAEVAVDVVCWVCAVFGRVAKDVALVTLAERSERCGKADVEPSAIYKGGFLYNHSEFPAGVRK